ncbi:sec-independent protein translocase protein TatC [Thioclava sp. ES.031]|uniref:twin-arginine translocase subunit TatC n=1 Tax=unclassified Thioclava TaxID=2621713 RepID=UPI0009964EF9|nr:MULTISPECIES: twin-arginine translocase subunit TatC [unclassified Thioclava]OOY07675.1 twin arginine-targeting protein translocase TatC [Thioclava sp. F36-7]PFG64092.1 sec-independent protein translocase protein TatC [Thioclava sp. ES.031]
MSDNNEIEESSAPLIEHLAELRTRILYSLGAFIVAMVVCYTVWNPIFNFLTRPVCSALESRGEQCGLYLIKLQEGFFVAINISFLGGFALAFPIIAYQMWRFVAPGLYRNEKNAFLPFLVASPVMFFLGAAFAYYIILPLAFNFFLGFQQGEIGATSGANEMAAIGFQGSVQEYLNLTIKFVMAFGICFQLPVLLSLMGKAGLVSSEGLGNMRKYAVVAILVVAAIATPPDVISQVILFTVVYGLYEVSIQLVKRIEKTREARMRAEGTWIDPDEWDDDEDEAGDDDADEKDGKA